MWLKGQSPALLLSVLMADIKCDLCNRVVQPEEGGWTYLTPNQADSALEASILNTFWAEDVYWLACKDCNTLVEANDLEALCIRWWELNPTMREDKYLDYAFMTLKTFMEHKTTRAWEDVVSPVGQVPPAEAFS